MISDTLHDAVKEIGEYQTGAFYYPRMGRDPALNAWIESVKAQMRALQEYLEQMPPYIPDGDD